MPRAAPRSFAQVLSATCVISSVETQGERGRFTVIESVRCLDCARVYSKPNGGGTVTANPGCPHCGYVGWIPLTIPFAAAEPRDRSAAGRLRGRLAPSG